MKTLAQYHAEQLKNPEYAAGFRLLELGGAIRVLREEAGMTRAQLGRALNVKAAAIAQVEEDTFDAPAGLVEAALTLLVRQIERPTRQTASAWRTVRDLRPALLPAA